MMSELRDRIRDVVRRDRRTRGELLEVFTRAGCAEADVEKEIDALLGDRELVETHVPAPLGGPMGL